MLYNLVEQKFFLPKGNKVPRCRVQKEKAPARDRRRTGAARKGHAGGIGMETTYLSMDARYVTVFRGVEEQASGGDRVCFTRRSRTSSCAPSPAGKVVDLAAYRRQLECASEPEEAPSLPTPMREEIPARSRPWSERVGLVLDLCATGAILCLTVGVLLCCL